MPIRTLFGLLISLVAGLSGCDAAPDQGNRDYAAEPFIVREIVTGLEHPWSMAFLPDGRILVTERPGRLRIIQDGQLQHEPIAGFPPIADGGQGGLLDVCLHPGFTDNGWIYFSYAAEGEGGFGTEVGRARLAGNRLEQWQTLFRLQPKSRTRHHFGSRLAFDREGYLYISLGDRGERFRAQDIGDHAGSVIRLHDDGRVPTDNPFVSRSGARPEIFSHGHRNPQGLALNPETGEIWLHEHGPQDGDEVNIIRKGANYGWPVITYGREYGTGFAIGEGTAKAGMEQPLYYWDPSIAPSGMAFYSGDRFPQWRGRLLVGALKFRLLAVLELADGKVIGERRYLENKLGRIRDVRSAPDGYIYLLTDEADGKLVRLEPLPS